MKTVTLTFVVDDEDEHQANKEVGDFLASSGGSFPVFAWDSRDSTKKELTWRKKYDKDKEQ